MTIIEELIFLLLDLGRVLYFRYSASLFGSTDLLFLLIFMFLMFNFSLLPTDTTVFMFYISW